MSEVWKLRAVTHVIDMYLPLCFPLCWQCDGVSPVLAGNNVAMLFHLFLLCCVLLRRHPVFLFGKQDVSCSSCAWCCISMCICSIVVHFLWVPASSACHAVWGVLVLGFLFVYSLCLCLCLILLNF